MRALAALLTLDHDLKKSGRFGDEIIHIDVPNAHDRADIVGLWSNKGVAIADGDAGT